MLHSPTRCCLRPTCQVPTPMNFEGSSILGTGAAFGNKYSSKKWSARFISNVPLRAIPHGYDKFVDRVFSKLQYDSNSVQLPKEDLFRRFNRSEYIQHRREALTDLAERAARKALADWGGNPQDVTHLFWGKRGGRNWGLGISLEGLLLYRPYRQNAMLISRQGLRQVSMYQLIVRDDNGEYR